MGSSGSRSDSSTRAEAATLNVNRRGWQTVLDMLAAWTQLPDILCLQGAYGGREAAFPQISYDVFCSGSGVGGNPREQAPGEVPEVLAGRARDLG